MNPTKFRFIWQSGFREDFFRNQPIRNKNFLWQPCLLTDWDEMSNLYRKPSIDASFCPDPSTNMAPQAILVSDWLISKKSSPLKPPCLLMDRDKKSKLYRGPSIDTSYQVSVHLAKGFQRRRLKCEKLQWTTDGKSSHILVSDWLISKKYSTLKPLCQMNQNLVGSILGRSSIEIAHLVPIR
jgi:hypothetical protein